MSRRGHDVLAIRNIAMGADDESVVRISIEEDRFLLTQDLDMGHIYYFSKREKLGIIVIRPRIQTAGNIKSILKDFLPDIEKRREKVLYIVEETGYRIRR